MSPVKTDVLLLDKGELAIQIGEWFLASPNHRLLAVVPSMPPPTWTASLPDWAQRRRVPLIESGRYEDLTELRDPDWKIDLAFSCFYSRIIRADFIRRCQRILNLHNAPLPRYRGVSPINWALKNEERNHGVTIHQITPGIDDGPIVNQVKFTIDPKVEEVIDVYRRCLKYGYTLFEDTLERLDHIVPVSQDESCALSYSRKDNDRLGDRRGFTRAESREPFSSHASE